MSKIFQKLGIEYVQYSKDQIDEAVESVQSLRLEQILVGECEPFEWNTILQRPELVECKDPSKVTLAKYDEEEFSIYAKNSIFMFKKDNPIRLGLITFMNNKHFKQFMLTMATLNILAYCLLDIQSDTDLKRIIVGLEVVCNVAFGLEIMFKIIAMGFILEKNTFMRDTWNAVSLLTFLCTWSTIPHYNGYQSTFITLLRTIRLLRVFRFLIEVPVLKTQLDAYFGSFSKLGPILVPLMFVMLYFSVVGLHLFTGLTERRCRLTPQPVNDIWEADPNILKLCGVWDCPEGRYCGSPDKYDLPRNWEENDYEAFTWNFTRFDNFFTSLLVVFTFLNVTGWSGTTFMYWKALTTNVTALYFLVLIVLLAFILSNLLLATFYESFMVQSSIKQSQSKAKQEQLQIEDEIQKKKQQQMMDRLAAMTELRKSRVINHNYNLAFSLYFDKTVNTVSKRFLNLGNIPNQLSKSLYFIILNQIMIVLNSIAIVVDYDGIPKSLQDAMQQIDFLCIIYSFIELGIQLLGKGWNVYLKKNVNVLDLIIIASQMILIIVLYILNENIIFSDNRTVHLFKALKIIRIMKFLYSVKLLYTISILTRCAIETILKLKNILLLWLALVLLVSLIGNELLSGKVTTPININYDTFGSSVMASFNIFYNEEWHITMFQYARETNVSLVFYVVFIILGQVFFIRLLTAVFLNEFVKQLQSIEQTVKPIEYQKTAKQFMQTMRNIIDSKPETEDFRQRAKSRAAKSSSLRMKQVSRRGILTNLRVEKRLSSNPIEDFKSRHEIVAQENDELIMEEEEKQEDVQVVNHPISNHVVQMLICESNSAMSPSPRKSPTMQKKSSTIVRAKTLFIFSEESTFRQKITIVIEHKVFKIFNLILIVITSVRISFVNPLLDPNSLTAQALQIIFIMLTILYSLQIMLYLIAYGFIESKNSYIFRSKFNIISLIITIVEIIQIITKTNHQAYNFLTSLRILEFIQIGAQFNEGIRYAQSALINAFAKMIQLSVFCFCMLLIYGTFGMKILKGYNFYCAGLLPSVTMVETKLDCMDYGGSWINTILGFDNVFDSTLTLFITATTEAWLPILIQTWSARGQDIIPINNHNRWWAAYFQIFFFIGNLCMLNMFIGLIVNTYQEAKLKAQGLDSLDDNQREWYNIKNSIYKLQPKVKSQVPSNPVRKVLFWMVKKPQFKILWLIIIFANTLVLSLYMHRQDTQFRNVLVGFNVAFIIIQTIEILVRLIAKGWDMYRKDLTNNIDIVGIWVCLIDVLIITEQNTNFNFARCFGAFSVAIQLLRNYRIIKRFNELQKLFSSIFSVIPSALSMIYIMFIFLFIYTNLGMDLFAYLRPQDYINDFDLHFRSFTTGMFSLVRVASSEQWWALLVDAVHVRTSNFACLDLSTYSDFEEHGFNGCGTKVAYLFFISYHLIFSLVILNLFIASLLGAYEEHVKKEQSAISKYQLNDVLQLWAQYDPTGQAFLNYKQFWKLSSEIAIIFGVNQADLLNPENKTNFLKALNISLYEDQSGILGYLFHDVILSLTRISVILKYGVSNLEPSNDNVLHQQKPPSYMKAYTKTPYNSGHMGAIIFLQKKIRVLINKKKGGGFLQIEDLRKALAEQELLEQK